MRIQKCMYAEQKHIKVFSDDDNGELLGIIVYNSDNSIAVELSQENVVLHYNDKKQLEFITRFAHMYEHGEINRVIMKWYDRRDPNDRMIMKQYEAKMKNTLGHPTDDFWKQRYL